MHDKVTHWVRASHSIGSVQKRFLCGLRSFVYEAIVDVQSLFKITRFDTHFGKREVFAASHDGPRHTQDTMSKSDHSDLVATSRDKLAVERIQRTLWPACRKGSLAKHGAKLTAAAFGDTSMFIFVTAAVHRGHETRVAAHLFAVFETVYIGQSSNEGCAHDRSHSGDLLELAPHFLEERAVCFELRFKCSDLLMSQTSILQSASPV